MIGFKVPALHYVSRFKHKLLYSSPVSRSIVMRPSNVVFAGHRIFLLNQSTDIPDMIQDPAIERWAGPTPPIFQRLKRLEWRNQQHRAFKWTPKTTALTILFGLAIPTGLIYMAYYTQVPTPS